MSIQREEQDLVCRVTGDAPAGAMFRRYWLPALLSEEVIERDGAPVRVRLLGENLVAFRDSNGALGLLAEGCPHRLASLALGRNEEGGLRCIYHGWKFDVAGRCVEMPTEPAESSYKDRMRARSYPVREAGGMIWAYLGPPELEPPFPVFEWAGVPRDNVAFLKFVEHANYLQVAEGSIDSAHTRFLHRGSVSNVEEARRNALSRDLAPRLEVADTSYGFRYAAIRRPNENADVLRYVKITRYVLPATAITSRPMTEGNPAVTQMFVPIDDENTMHYSIWHSLDGKPVDEAGMRRAKGLEPGVDLDRGYRPHRSEANWWGQDPQAMRNGSWTGIVGAEIQDAAVQESMGAITDHSRERLGTSDIAIIRLRRRLLENVRRFLAGKPLIGLEFPVDYGRLCHVSQCAIGMNERWEDIDTFAGEYVTPQPAAAG